MTLSRRKTLALIGGGTVFAASAAAGFAVTRMPEAAIAPWAAAGGYADPRLRALSYAILAPKAIFANTDTAMGHLWQISLSNSRGDQIASGRDWVRLNLAATSLGLGMQPLSQALQEYPEMAQLYAQIHDRLAPEGGIVQMFARIGYGPEVPASPRWALEEKIVG